MNTLYRLPLILSVLSLIVLGGCSASNDESGKDNPLSDSKKITQDSSNTIESRPNEPDKLKTKIEKHMNLTGTIVYQHLEGGFYSFISHSGEKYLPIGLKTEHKKNGLVVSLKARKIEEMVSFHQFGENIQVLDVEVLSDANVVPIHKDI